jgi:hypothetical protein
LLGTKLGIPVTTRSVDWLAWQVAYWEGADAAQLKRARYGADQLWPWEKKRRPGATGARRPADPGQQAGVAASAVGYLPLAGTSLWRDRAIRASIGP